MSPKNRIKTAYGVLMVVSVIAVASGCSKHRDNQDRKTEMVENKDVGCITQDDTKIEDESKVQKQTVTLKREFQRVQRKNCEGQVISDKEETVTEPRGMIEIKPLGELQSSTYVYDWVRNRTTCKGRRNYDAFRNNFIVQKPAPMQSNIASSFTISTSPEAFSSLYVMKSRDNYIDYRYYACTGKEGAYCDTQKVLEEGTLILTVDYKEERKDGIKEIDDCRRDKDGKEVSIK